MNSAQSKAHTATDNTWTYAVVAHCSHRQHPQSHTVQCTRPHTGGHRACNRRPHNLHTSSFTAAAAVLMLAEACNQRRTEPPSPMNLWACTSVTASTAVHDRSKRTPTAQCAACPPPQQDKANINSGLVAFHTFMCLRTPSNSCGTTHHNAKILPDSTPEHSIVD